MTIASHRRALLGMPFLLLGAGQRAAAQAYPNRAVRVVLGFAAGGATDIVARLLSARLSERLGQPFVVENRPGAGTLLAAEMVARAAPDGHVLMFASSSTIITPLINRSSTIDPTRDFAAVALCQSSPLILVANKDLPARTLPEVVALARERPGRITVSHPGTGGINHLSVEMLARREGVSFTLVPFTGNQPSLTALMRGDVNLASDSYFATRPLLESGSIRPIATTGPARSPVLPDVPTVGESLPGYEAVFWSGFLAPRGTPEPVLDRLHGEVESILKLPDVLERLASFGADPGSGTRAEFTRQIAADWENWGKVVRETGVTGN